jgi:hypothetical protein
LAEVAVAMGISALTLVGVVFGYTSTCSRAEWSAHSLAAQALAMQRIEQTRAAKWDLQAWPAVDELQGSNFPVQIEVLDIPISGTNVSWATNTTTITEISANPPLKMVRVDCRWRFVSRGLFTNTVVVYRAPDQ